jgi:hypothetical protein
MDITIMGKVALQNMNSVDQQFFQCCLRGDLKSLQNLIIKNPNYKFDWNRAVVYASKYTPSAVYPLLIFLVQQGANNFQCFGDREIPQLLNQGLSPRLFKDRAKPALMNRITKQEKINDLLQCILIDDVIGIVLSYVAYEYIFKTYDGKIVFY